MDWIEEEINRRTKIVKKWNIKTGDFINLDAWFCDVWAEVKEISGDYIIRYRYDGKYKTDMVYMGNIKKICRRENRDKIDSCYIISADGIIEARYPINANAYSFQGDENINVYYGDD